jgi:hypothetical protein
MNGELYRPYLETIAAGNRELGSALQPACPEARIIALRVEAKSKLSAEIPDEYADFLRITDGLNWNGVFIYASHRALLVGHRDLYINGFVEMNEIWREETDPDGNYLFYADADLDLYGYNLERSRYELVTKDSGDIETTYDSFNEMLAAALRYSVKT